MSYTAGLESNKHVGATSCGNEANRHLSETDDESRSQLFRSCEAEFGLSEAEVPPPCSSPTIVAFDSLPSSLSTPPPLPTASGYTCVSVTAASLLPHYCSPATPVQHCPCPLLLLTSMCCFYIGGTMLLHICLKSLCRSGGSLEGHLV